MDETGLNTQQRLAIRKRLLQDFEFYAKHCVKIRTKDAKIVPLLLNQVQRRFVKRIIRQLTTRGRVRFVVLKARQQGLSTVISALQYWWVSQRKAMKGLVMAHDADGTETLFLMYQRIHDNMAEWVKPATKYSSKTELSFAKLDSGLRVATAGGRGVARGDTIQFAHLSEVAFWPVAFANKNFNGLIQAVPEEDGTFVFVESTAQGVSGKFYELWDNATAMGYEQFFSAWFESAEYRDDDVSDDFVRTPDEEDLAEQFDLDNAQLFWRRKKVAANGLELFRQEYPATPEEAFVSTGRPVFNSDFIMERLKTPTRPIKTMLVTPGSVAENPRGDLKVYRELETGETYTIGADVGMGLRPQGKKEGDPSVAQVLDSQKRQVAVWRGNVHPDYFAQILTTLGYYYHTALIAPERNNHGLLTCVKIRDSQYPSLWVDVTEGTLEDNETIQLGFFTSEKTKPLIIDKLRASEREREITIYDETTLREMLTFVVTESGRLEAEGDTHDDCVMALAIANHVHEGKWTPITFSEDHYLAAI